MSTRDALEAAVWLAQRMQEPAIQAPVVARLRNGGHKDISAWAKADPDAVIVMRDALDDLADQDATFERDVLNAGRIPSEPPADA